MDSTIKNNIIEMKEDMALKIFNSENGNFNDLKKLNLLFDLILKFIDFLELIGYKNELIQLNRVYKYQTP